MRPAPAREDETQRGSGELTPGLTCPACSPGTCVCTRVCVVPCSLFMGVGSVATARPRRPNAGTRPGPPPPCPRLTAVPLSLLPRSEGRKSPHSTCGVRFRLPGGLMYHWPLPPPVQRLWSPVGRGRTRWPVPIWAAADGPLLNIRARALGEPHAHTFKEQKVPPESPSG